MEIFHAGTRRDGNRILAAGGRVLNVAATASTVGEAQKRAYEAVGRIDWARNNRFRLMMNMTGGGHSIYLTNGVFDMAKWKARMATYNTAAIKDAIAKGVADGTIVGNSWLSGSRLFIRLSALAGQRWVHP